MECKSSSRTPLVRLVAILLTALFLASLVPLLFAARYAAPESDDLLYGQEAHDAFLASPTPDTIVFKACERVAHHHQIAHGRYANTFLGVLFLGTFGLDHYAAVPVIMLFALICSTLLFAYALLCRTLHADRWTWLAVSMYILLFCVQLMPSPAEGVYWFCGGLGYTFYYSLTLTLFALLLFVQASKCPAWRIVCGALAAVLAAIVAGLGFTVLIITAALLAGYIALAILQKRRDMLVFGILTLAVFIAGSLVQLTAPATTVRAAWEQEMYGYTPSGPVKAVLLSFVYALCTLLHRLDGGMLLYVALVSACMAPFLKKSGCRFRLPLLMLAGSFCLYATMFTASLYSTSSMGPYRQWNLMYFAMFPFWGVNAAYMTGWALRRMERRSGGALSWNTLCERAGALAGHRAAILAVMAVLMLSSVFVHGFYETTSVAALQETRNGSAAARYSVRMAEIAANGERAEREATRLFLY